MKYSEFTSDRLLLSDRIPLYEKSFFYDCQRLLYELKLQDLEFLTSTFCQPGNNISGSFWMFLENLHQMPWERRLLSSLPLGYIDSLFQSDELKRNYEGVYNTLNFIKNALYRKLKYYYGIKLKKERLIHDFEVNKFFLEGCSCIQELCIYLDSIKALVPNSRSSVSNNIITKGKAKIGNNLTYSQQSLSDAAAFICFIDELEENNYKPTKRLIYIPRNKI